MGVTTTKTVAVTGNQAVAEALRQLNPDVMPAYPITPSTGIMESFTSFVSNGKVDTETILVESEHSAMSACIGASAAGGGWQRPRAPRDSPSCGRCCTSLRATACRS